MDYSNFCKMLDEAKNQDDVNKAVALLRVEVMHDKGMLDEDQLSNAKRHIDEGRYTDDDYMVWLVENCNGNIKLAFRKLAEGLYKY